VRGVINLRGNILPIVEIRDMLSLAPPSAIAGQIVIIKHDTSTIGIVVDNVYEVTSVPVSSVLTIPADFGAQPGRNRSRFFIGIIQRETGLAALLNIERIFEEIKLS
jgi:chemotaxis signal transduction protein